jgi:hypothetical protein
MRFRASQIVMSHNAGAGVFAKIRANINGLNVNPELSYSIPTGTTVYGSMDIVLPVTTGDTIDIRACVTTGGDILIGFTAPGFEMISST